MIAFPPRYVMPLFFMLAFCAKPARLDAQIVSINEIVASASNRLLNRDAGGYPRVGNTVSWVDPSFDDSRWTEGRGPFGFGAFEGITYGAELSGLLRNKAQSLYLRGKFEVGSVDTLSEKTLRLKIRYNDGVIVFINGVEVLRRYLGRPGAYVWHDQSAYARTSGEEEVIQLGPASDYLKAGENSICVQVNNVDFDANMLFSGSLDLGDDDETLVGEESVWRYFPGYVEPSGGLVDHGLISRYFAQRSGVAWAGLPFDTSGWRTAAGPVGIDGNGEYEPVVNLFEEAGGATSFYTRRIFEVSPEEAASLEPLTLTLDYDDAVIVYLNGREVARRNVAGSPGDPVPYDAVARSVHKANNVSGTIAGQEETLTLAPAKELLRPGNNILAVQCLRTSPEDAEAIARVTLFHQESERVFVSPTDEVTFFVGGSEPVNLSLPPDDLPDDEHDWIELVNNTDEDIDLEGWRLTDSESNNVKWTFPAGATIPARGYLVVVASGLNLDPPRDGTDYHHCNFELSADGEYLALLNRDGVVVSEIYPGFPPAHPGYSWARRPDGSFGWSAVSTPGAENPAELLADPPEDPVFYPAAGFHDQPVTVLLTSRTSGATIRYTLDGSEPTMENGADYQGSFVIDKSCLIRARAFLDGSRPSGVVSRTFLVNEPAARRTVPALCLGGDPRLIFYGANSGVPGGEGIMAIEGGVYSDVGVWGHDGNPDSFNNPMTRGRSSEKPASLDFFPVSGAALHTETGLRLSGSGNMRPRYALLNDSQSMFDPYIQSNKPSFNVFFRKDFGGERPQTYPFFPDSPVNTFTDIRLRAGKNDNGTPFVVDELMRRIYLGTGQKSSRGGFVALYINGVYKGYYNMCERLREGFMRAHHGGEATWDILQNGVVANGDYVEWERFRKFLRSTDFTKTEEYLKIHEYFDVDNFIDYLLVNIYGATVDWPHNNWVAARERAPEGRWRFYMWDAEGAFGRMGGGVSPGVTNLMEQVLAMDRQAALNATSQYAIPSIYTLLKDSPEFRLRFADRIHKHFFHSGALTRERMESLFQEVKEEVEPIMRDTIGVGVHEGFYNDWIATETRREAVFGHFVEAGFWPATPAPEISPHGGEVNAGQIITISVEGEGDIYYTVDGTDPRLPGGEPAGRLYQESIPYTGFKTLRARFRSASGEWSAETVADFSDLEEEHRFLPDGDGEWNQTVNWSTEKVPALPGARVRFDIPSSGTRNVELAEPVAVGSLRFDLGNANGRTRLRANATEGALLFDNGGNPALLEVRGEGAGYVELDLNTSVKLRSDLRLDVSNRPGHSEHGALRLRGDWEGTGGLVKTGAGIASLTGNGKSFTGPVVIEQGALVLTESSVPHRASRIRVEEGGQLLLTSGGYGVQRRYGFAAPIQIAGEGRQDDELTGGAPGALRYQPEEPGSHAVVEAPVELTAEASVHVEGESNTLEFFMPVSGEHRLVKTGAGELRLSVINPALTSPARIVEGTLNLRSDFTTPVLLERGAVLKGYGSSGEIEGEGAVYLDGTMIQAPSVEAASYTFVFRQNSPDYGNGRDSGNGVIYLTSQAPKGGEVNFYIEFPQPDAPVTGGFFAPASADLASAMSSMTVRVFHADPAGTHVFKNRNWSQVPVARAIVVPAVADFGEGQVAGETVGILYIDRFDQWRSYVFSNPEDRDDPLVSGVDADPDGDGLSNLVEYAIGLNPRIPDALEIEETSGDNISPGLPVVRVNSATKELEVLYSRRIPTDASDVIVRPQFSDDLIHWIDSVDSPARVTADNEVEILSVPFPQSSKDAKSFFRLKIELMSSDDPGDPDE